MRIVVPVAVIALGFAFVSSPADATGRWRRDHNWHQHGHVQGHHHHYFDNRIYTYNYRPYIPGPRSYYRAYNNHHLTMEYTMPYGQVPVYGAPPAYGYGPARHHAPGNGRPVPLK